MNNKKNTEKKTNEQMQIVIKEEAVKKLVINNLVESIKEKLKLKAAKEATKEKLRLSATTIGKATLMVQQSLEENRNNRDQAFCSFAARIKAVKREAERTELQTKVLSLIAKNQGEEWVLDEKKIEGLFYQENDNQQNTLTILKKLEPNQYRDLLLDTWGGFHHGVFNSSKNTRRRWRASNNEDSEEELLLHFISIGLLLLQ